MSPVTLKIVLRRRFRTVAASFDTNERYTEPVADPTPLAALYIAAQSRIANATTGASHELGICKSTFDECMESSKLKCPILSPLRSRL